MTIIYLAAGKYPFRRIRLETWAHVDSHYRENKLDDWATRQFLAERAVIRIVQELKTYCNPARLAAAQAEPQQNPKGSVIPNASEGI